MVQDRDFVNRDRCYYRRLIGSDTDYRIVAIPMTLSDLQGHSTSTILFTWDFSYIRATID